MRIQWNWKIGMCMTHDVHFYRTLEKRII